MTHQKNAEGAVELQKVYLYQWDPTPKTQPVQLYYTEFGAEQGDIYNDLKFNPNPENYIEYLVTSPKKIFFSVLDTKNPERTKAYYPNDLKVPDSHVQFTQSIFLKATKGNIDTAITGTTGGYIIVWDVCEALSKDNEVVTDRRRIKEVDLLGRYKKDKDKKSGNSEKDHINILVNYEEYIVIGTGGGTVNFYDYNFIIVRWFENICWLVKSISFDMAPADYKASKMDDDGNNTGKFGCVPFIISDISGTVKRVHMEREDLISVGDENLKFEEIYRGIESEITCIAVHPKKNIIAVGTRGICPYERKTAAGKPKDKIIKEKKFEYRPYVQLFTYPDHMKSLKKENEEREKLEKQKKLLNSKKNLGKKKGLYGKDNADEDEGAEKHSNKNKRYFINDYPTVLEFAPYDEKRDKKTKKEREKDEDYDLLMVGTSSQKILPLNVDNIAGQTLGALQIREIADKEENAEIQEIIFSPDNKHFAAADNKKRFGVFYKEKKNSWNILGRYVFQDLIKSFCFNETGTQVFVITSRMLYSFKVEDEDPTAPKDLLFKNYNLNPLFDDPTEVEKDCNLNKIIWYPADEREKKTIIANDQFKLRILNVAEKPSIVKTSLGPCFGGPLVNMKNLKKEKDKRLIAFTTKEKIMGLMLLPLDGNPYRYMGVIAHPGIIKEMKPAVNSNYIFTTGGIDFTINIWRYNCNPLDNAVKDGGEGIEPFLQLLEGGKTGTKYKEMVDFFYYTQISSKNENTTKHRVLDQTVASTQMNGLLSSLGYYPSHQDLQNIVNEVRYSKRTEAKGEKNEDVDFDTFVKIFLNHRPYVEMDVDTIEAAFNKMRVSTSMHAIKDNTKYILEKENLIKCLRENKVEEEKINNLITYLEEGVDKDPYKIEHYQKEIRFDLIRQSLETFKIDPSLREKIAKDYIEGGTNMSSNATVLYKLYSNVIHRDNLFHMLKENGEKMDDNEIKSILNVLLGVSKIEDLPLMISFDYLFGDMLRMEKEDKEINV
ncbi:MAG: hypothetical protein MJ252_17295 [archaeon]|nr:hypothetical protein [archaeon]